MTILAERDLADAEREAVADEPRAGTVFGFDDPIPQHATDVLIAYELSQKLSKGERAELIDLVGKVHPVNFGAFDSRREQRGGIHSEPLVRLLAFRAWGDRDRKWFAHLKPLDTVGGQTVNYRCMECGEMVNAVINVHARGCVLADRRPPGRMHERR